MTRLLFTSCLPLLSLSLPPGCVGVSSRRVGRWSKGSPPRHSGCTVAVPIQPRAVILNQSFKSFRAQFFSVSVQFHHQTLAGIVYSLTFSVHQLLNGNSFEDDASLSHVLGTPAVIPRSSHVLPPAVCDGRNPGRQN